ncbi:MAG: mannitol dehydrogenase family protein [Paracoccaceae bacterium]|nr:mannitol dehydrogenase family protein [Paracoccaceae bacterium]
MKLSNAALPNLPAGVARPSYDRASLTAGIVHIGVGNFHRAHQAVYLDDLFNLGEGHDWALIGAGVRAGDAKMRAALAAQDNLTTVIELDPAGNRARVTGAMIGFVEVQADNAALIAQMTAPAIRIVSLTVTEGGYYVDPATGVFDPTHPDIVADGKTPDRPATAFGAILAALKARRAAGQQPFTVMSCDNLPGNGHVTRDAVVGLARLSDPALADWVAANVAFPNAMVDRITPATGPREIALAQRFGIEDAAPVTCEPFRQWVVEDRFPAGRPALEKVGVTFTDHVHLYESMKIRILNGGHAIIAYAGGLLDIEFAHEAMAHPLIRGFLERIEREEVIPHVPPVPDTDLNDYYKLIENRFSNPEIADTIRRLCLDGSNRQPKFIIPSLRDNLARGTVPVGLILESALWCRYCAGTTESGATIAPNDPSWDMLTATAQKAKADPNAWLGMAEIYGETGRDPQVQAAFAKALNAIWSRGTKAVLEDYVAGRPL